jgi:hypothetical protein
MGFSEWGIMIKNDDDYKMVLDIISDHNTTSEYETGENIQIGGIFQYEGFYHLCVFNYGGHSFTSKFIRNQLREIHFNKNQMLVIYYPYNKPCWWSEEKEYIWRIDDKKPLPELF